MALAFQAVSFDCYGTLIDWETGITECMTEILGSRKTSVAPKQLLEARGEIEFKMIQGAYRSYSEILRDSLRQALGRFGIEYDERDGDRLVDSVPERAVFPETDHLSKGLGGGTSLSSYQTLITP